MYNAIQLFYIMCHIKVHEIINVIYFLFVLGGHYLLFLEVDADGKGKMFLVISPSNILIFSDQMILIPRKIASYNEKLTPH